MQCHEVLQKSVEITEHIKELLYNLDISCLLCQLKVFGDKSEEFFLPIVLKICLAGIKSERLNASTCLGSLPC